MHKIIAQQAIVLLDSYIRSLSYKPVIHFELEGCYVFESEHNNACLNFSAVNKTLKSMNIDGELVAEYWKNQWEYVSMFNGQSPLKEANNLSFVIHHLPDILARQNVVQTLIKPVVWSGDRGQLGANCENVFSTENRAVHIPNAVQINVSLLNETQQNLVAETAFGDYLQHAFLHSSLNCCLLYLPEEEAFERLQLKSRYGLDKELCSPDDISGGHQGSIALYKKVGKHNQAMGAKTLVLDQYNQALVNEYQWQETARVEHRLGASSIHYCPYVNVVFALLNIIDALENFQLKSQLNSSLDLLVDEPSSSTQLPVSLYDSDKGLGAISLFEQDKWFDESINTIQNKCSTNLAKTLALANLPSVLPEKLGDCLKRTILSKYQTVNEIIFN